jgi:hypothetical protein
MSNLSSPNTYSELLMAAVVAAAVVEVAAEPQLTAEVVEVEL